MRLPLNALALVAFSFFACAATARAAPTTEPWMSQARHNVDRKLVGGDVRPGQQVLELSMHIDGDGLLDDPHLLGTTGSRELDHQITDAVRHVSVDAPPATLSGGTVIFRLHVTPARTAWLPVPLDR